MKKVKCLEDVEKIDFDKVVFTRDDLMQVHLEFRDQVRLKYLDWVEKKSAISRSGVKVKLNNEPYSQKVKRRIARNEKIKEKIMRRKNDRDKY